MEMPPPKSIKQLISLQGKLKAIKIFISQLVDRTTPFSYFLNKGNKYISNEEC